MRNSEILRQARAINEANRCVNSNAVDELGCSVDPRSEHARQWCALGALSKVTGVEVHDLFLRHPALRMLVSASSQLGLYGQVSYAHDKSRQSAAAMWDKAIEIAETLEAHHADN